MTLQPQINVAYEAGRYTATIAWGDETIITDGQTLDSLLANIDDAFACHMHATQQNYSINLSIPAITFVYESSSHAIES